MRDLIDRQAAIAALSEAGLINYAATGDGNGMIQAVNVIKGLPSAQPEQRWIPCSERLPDQYGNYLISIDREEPDIGTINPNDPRGWSLCDANGFIGQATKHLILPHGCHYQNHTQKGGKNEIS